MFFHVRLCLQDSFEMQRHLADMSLLGLAGLQPNPAEARRLYNASGTAAAHFGLGMMDHWGLHGQMVRGERREREHGRERGNCP